MSITIEKNVPIPAKKTSKYPLRDLEVGDSFVVQDASERSSAIVASQRYGIKVATRALSDGTYRVWRTK